MKYLKVPVSIIIILAILIGCTINQPKTLLMPTASFTEIDLEEVSSTISDSVAATNHLGYSLLINSQESKNTLISPVSLSIALAMSCNAAAGETAQNIAEVMGNLETTSINPNYNALISHLNRENEDDKIQIGNSFWIHNTLEAKQTFVDALSKDFNAEIHGVDFSDKNTVNLMNTWVEEKTNGLLKNTLSEIDASNIAYLMNTVYFKGKWVYEFSEAATMTLPFYLTGDSTISVPMMTQTNTFQYNENVYIGDIFQNARIINDEGGTEAATVTVIEFGETSLPIVDEPIVFNCNKPFFYIIEDVTTGVALFMGTYWGQE